MLWSVGMSLLDLVSAGNGQNKTWDQLTMCSSKGCSFLPSCQIGIQVWNRTCILFSVFKYVIALTALLILSECQWRRNDSGLGGCYKLHHRSNRTKPSAFQAAFKLSTAWKVMCLEHTVGLKRLVERKVTMPMSENWKFFQTRLTDLHPTVQHKVQRLLKGLKSSLPALH